MIHYMVSFQLCRAPKLHEGLAHLFTKTENFTQSTTEIVVPSSHNDDRSHCMTIYKCTCISGGSRRFHKRDPFYFRNHLFKEISKDTET